ncbi:hypothetical protein H4R99_006786, partial [Coemansia sp. RSA 1722]
MSSRVVVRMAPALKGRRKPLTLTNAAVERLKELQETSQPEEKNKTLKIGIQGKGCSGNAYTLSW